MSWCVEGHLRGAEAGSMRCKSVQSCSSSEFSETETSNSSPLSRLRQSQRVIACPARRPHTRTGTRGHRYPWRSKQGNIRCRNGRSSLEWCTMRRALRNRVRPVPACGNGTSVMRTEYGRCQMCRRPEVGACWGKKKVLGSAFLSLVQDLPKPVCRERARRLRWPWPPTPSCLPVHSRAASRRHKQNRR